MKKSLRSEGPHHQLKHGAACGLGVRTSGSTFAMTLAEKQDSRPCSCFIHGSTMVCLTGKMSEGVKKTLPVAVAVAHPQLVL